MKNLKSAFISEGAQACFCYYHFPKKSLNYPYSVSSYCCRHFFAALGRLLSPRSQIYDMLFHVQLIEL